FGPPLSDRLSPEKVKEFAGSLGLKEAKQFDAGPYHYGFVLVK
ncbi:TPA: class I SAM-dependent methyltransferase, partial [Patescibacteria group bacterium]|nr:class I SAM-dependent methyltransferase [Patescibacteria group bacterium]